MRLADARIGSSFDDIEQIVGHPDVDLNLRVALMEDRQHGGEQQRAHMFEQR